MAALNFTDWKEKMKEFIINVANDIKTLMSVKADKITNIHTGSYLEGGGDLSTDRTIDLNTSSITKLNKAHDAVSKGTGLTGQDVVETNGLKIDTAAQKLEMMLASETQLGTIKIGDNLNIDPDGTLNAEQGDYTLPIASDTVLGGVLIPAGSKVTINPANGAIDVENVGVALEFDSTGSNILLKDGDGDTLSTINVAALNNEGTTIVFNSATEEIELRNDDGDLLSSFPASALVSGLGNGLNLNGSTLELTDPANAVVDSVTLTIANIQGLQDALDLKVDEGIKVIGGTGLLNVGTQTLDTNAELKIDPAYTGFTNYYTQTQINDKSWQLKVNGTIGTDIKFGDLLNFIGGQNVTIAYTSGGDLTFEAVDTTYEVFDETQDGLVPQPTNSRLNYFLNEAGNWVKVNDVAYTAGEGLDLSGSEFSLDTDTQTSLLLADSSLQEETDTLQTVTDRGAITNNGINIGKRHLSSDVIYQHADGILIKTNIPETSQRMVVLRITGNGYQIKQPIDAILQFYNYAGNEVITQFSYLTTDKLASNLEVFIKDGVVCMWFENSGISQTYSFELITNYGTPTITSVTDEVMPTTGVTRQETVIPHLSWDSSNDGAGSNLDADLLDGEEGSHYLDYDNLINTPTIPTDTTYTAGTGLDLTGTEFSLDTDTQTSLENGDTAYGWGDFRDFGLGVNNIPLKSLVNGIIPNVPSGFYASGSSNSIVSYPRYITISRGGENFGLLFSSNSKQAAIQFFDGTQEEIWHSGNLDPSTFATENTEYTAGVGLNLSASDEFSLKTASATVKGGVKVGATMKITSEKIDVGDIGYDPLDVYVTERDS